MGRYVLLLRGVNVGGNNKISMPALKAVLRENGLTDVVTYINSGNIIFSSIMDDEIELKRLCERLITERFGINIPAAVISAGDMVNTIQNAPHWWGIECDSKHNAIFVIPPVSPNDVLRQVGDVKEEYEQVGVYGQVIFWSAPIKTFSRTKWSKAVNLPLYDNITIRNANTAKKLAALAESSLTEQVMERT